VVHGAIGLPLVLHGEPVLEDDPAHLHGPARHVAHPGAHRTLPEGKDHFTLNTGTAHLHLYEGAVFPD